MGECLVGFDGSNGCMVGWWGVVLRGIVLYSGGAGVPIVLWKANRVPATEVSVQGQGKTYWVY